MMFLLLQLLYHLEFPLLFFEKYFFLPVKATSSTIFLPGNPPEIKEPILPTLLIKLLGANLEKPVNPLPIEPNPAVPAYNNAALPIGDFATFLTDLVIFLTSLPKPYICLADSKSNSPPIGPPSATKALLVKADS